MILPWRSPHLSVLVPPYNTWFPPVILVSTSVGSSSVNNSRPVILVSAYSLHLTFHCSCMSSSRCQKLGITLLPYRQLDTLKTLSNTKHARTKTLFCISYPQAEGSMTAPQPTWRLRRETFSHYSDKDARNPQPQQS